MVQAPPSIVWVGTRVEWLDANRWAMGLEPFVLRAPPSVLGEVPRVVLLDANHEPIDGERLGAVQEDLVSSTIEALSSAPQVDSVRRVAHKPRELLVGFVVLVAWWLAWERARQRAGLFYTEKLRVYPNLNRNLNVRTNVYLVDNNKNLSIYCTGT